MSNNLKLQVVLSAVDKLTAPFAVRKKAINDWRPLYASRVTR
ncbi:hypothetical protein [Proteus vulgaris]|nr:hypothetical protein [Proteus vulgaris]